MQFWYSIIKIKIRKKINNQLLSLWLTQQIFNQKKKKKKNRGILWFIVNVWFCKSLRFLEQFAGK